MRYWPYDADTTWNWLTRDRSNVFGPFVLMIPKSQTIVTYLIKGKLQLRVKSNLHLLVRMFSKIRKCLSPGNFSQGLGIFWVCKQLDWPTEINNILNKWNVECIRKSTWVSCKNTTVSTRCTFVGRSRRRLANISHMTSFWPIEFSLLWEWSTLANIWKSKLCRKFECR